MLSHFTNTSVLTFRLWRCGTFCGRCEEWHIQLPQLASPLPRQPAMYLPVRWATNRARANTIPQVWSSRFTTEVHIDWHLL